MPHSESHCVTPSERYLSRICQRSFLSLWSYPNLYTDEGRRGGKGVGHELCDLLVVFGNDVIIFSDKYILFNDSIDLQTAWRRWYRKAISESATQVFGAERWLRDYPDRIYIDSHCQHKLPIVIPSKTSMRVHRICVSLGVYDACKDYFGGNSLGSLIVDSSIRGDSQHLDPFRIGHISPSKGFVHVFEDFTLDVIFSELDTISDFTAYLSKREDLLSRDKPRIIAAGDEQLLSIYLTNVNSSGEHDFVLPTEGDEIPDCVSFGESFWVDMVQHPQYIAKKREDKKSYAWDRLIGHFILHGETHDLTGQRGPSPTDLELSLRHMVAEPRLRRRQLTSAFLDLAENTPQGKRAARVVYSNDFPEKGYVFLILPHNNREDYEEYREHRRALLVAYCKVAKLRCTKASYIIGVATESIGDKGSSEDLLALDVKDWSPEMQEEAEGLRDDFSLLRDSNVKFQWIRSSEYPEVGNPPKSTRTADCKKMNKNANRKRMQKASRRRNRR